MINAYSVWLKGDEKNASTIYAATAAKARADYWRHVEELFESPRKLWILLRSKRLNINVKEGMRPNLKITARLRDIPFVYVGMKVTVSDEVGYIVDGNSSANLDVYFPGGEHKGLTLNCHPGYRMRFFDQDDKEILSSYSKEKDAVL